GQLVSKNDPQSRDFQANYFHRSWGLVESGIEGLTQDCDHKNLKSPITNSL
ncbi:6081_t:CDS:1, partial [Racocetra persica]